MVYLIRSLTCWQCKHLAKTKAREGSFGQDPIKGLCELNHKWGKLKRGQNCAKFEYKQLDKNIADDGLEIKNRQPLDYRTENQWLECGRKLKERAVGKEMHPSRHNLKKKYCYYLIDETEPI